jgi:septum formation protein
VTGTLILASKSAARRAMLIGAGVPHEATSADVDEGALKVGLLAGGADPSGVALALARAKAEAASREHGGLVLGSDQTLDLDGALIDKAESLDEARARLIDLRGKGHVLHSAAALAVDGETVWSAGDSARMQVRNFSDAFLDAYLAAEGEPILSSVGCYRLEGVGAQLFERIEGDYFTVLGMPLWAVLAELRARGVLAQ